LNWKGSGNGSFPCRRTVERSGTLRTVGSQRATTGASEILGGGSQFFLFFTNVARLLLFSIVTVC
jgi:hypothetical protein